MNYYETYNYSDFARLNSIAAGILAIYLIVLMVLLIFYAISYIFKGIGMYIMAKRQGMDYPWLSFIPFARTYLHGELAGGITLKKKKIKNPGIWLLVMPFIYGAVNVAFYLAFWIIGFRAMSNLAYSTMYDFGNGYNNQLSSGMIMGLIVIAAIWIIVTVLYQAVYKSLAVLVDHHILGRFTTKNMSIAHAVLCIFIPLYESICFFVMRNRDFNQGMEPDFRRTFTQVLPVVPPTEEPDAPPILAPDSAPEPIAVEPASDSAESVEKAEEKTEEDTP